MDDPHQYLPVRMAAIGDEFWFESWLWEVAMVGIGQQRAKGRPPRPVAKIRARSIHRPHHYATIVLDPEDTVAFLHKEYA